MKYTSKLMLIVSLSISSFTSSASTVPLCPIPSKVIDGCSFDAIGEETHELVESLAQILSLPYKKKFTSSCNKHDICYQTIGKSQKQCDLEFKADLYSKCKFDGACRLTAKAFYEAVNKFGSGYYRNVMNSSLSKAETLENNVDNESCISDAKYSELYKKEMVSSVNSEFSTRVGRAPTTMEEFDLLNDYRINPDNSINDFSNWRSRMISKINNQYIGTKGPDAVQYRYSQSDPTGWVHAFNFDAKYSQGGSLNYKWHINGSEIFESKFRKTTPPGPGLMILKGYLKVSNNYGKDFEIIDESFYVNSCRTAICNIER